MKRVTFALAVALLASAVCAPQSRAWGCKGHQTVAYLAEHHLTPEAKALVQDLLGAHPIDPGLPRWCGSAVTDLMADGATWPDDIRGQASHPSKRRPPRAPGCSMASASVSFRWG